MSSRIRNFVKSTAKYNGTINILGCTLNFFKSWIELNFDKNMSWDNYGKYWDLDHIKPCASYNLNNSLELYECFNWSNYRPYEHIANIKKSNKIDDILISIFKIKSIIFKSKQLLLYSL